MGWTDVSVNSQAMLCEKFSGRSTIGFFHAFYSGGALVGVLFGGALVQAEIAPLLIFSSFTMITFLPTVLFKYWLFSYEEEKSIEGREKLMMTDDDITETDDVVVVNFNRLVEKKSVGGSVIDENIADKEDIEMGIRSADCKEGEYKSEIDTERRETSATYDTANDGNTDVEIDSLDLHNSLLRGTSFNTLNTVDNNNDDNDNNDNSALNAPSADSNESHTKSSKEKSNPDFWILPLLCSLGGLAYTGEGSIGDWSTVYLVIELKSSPFIGVLGFAMFQLIVCIVRYSSDSIVEVIDRKLLLQIAGCLACLGLGVVGLAPSLPPPFIVPMAIIGFAICGAGLSVVAPIVIYFAGIILHHHTIVLFSSAFVYV